MRALIRCDNRGKDGDNDRRRYGDDPPDGKAGGQGVAGIKFPAVKPYLGILRRPENEPQIVNAGVFLQGAGDLVEVSALGDVDLPYLPAVFAVEPMLDLSAAGGKDLGRKAAGAVGKVYAAKLNVVAVGYLADVDPLF